VPTRTDLAGALSAARVQDGTSVRALSDTRPLLLVLLRSLGCTFCREALGDLAAQRPAIEHAGATLVLVHMEAEAEAGPVIAGYGLGDVPRVSDGGRALYRALHLREARPAEILTRAVLVRGLEAWRAGHRMGWPRTNPRQMPGLFLLYRGEIADSFRHETVADRPDYVAFVRGGGSPAAAPGGRAGRASRPREQETTIRQVLSGDPRG
jgi:hypothetical protein